MLDFSIVIPTYNRPQHVKNCLDSIVCLNYPTELFETIVVDDGSDLPLDAEIAPYRDRLNLTLIRQTNAGPATARNIGADAATAKYLAFTDDDCTLDSNWLLTLKTEFASRPTQLFGGKTINALSNNIYSTASQLLLDYLYEYHTTKACPAPFFASNNFAVDRELFIKTGKFDVTFPIAAAEDREFCDRWLLNEYSLYYLPTAIAYHYHDLSLSKFWRQHFNYGTGAFYYHQIRFQRGVTPMQGWSYRDFYSKLLKYPFRTTLPHDKLFLSSLMAISQFANAAGFFRLVLLSLLPSFCKNLPRAGSGR
jgi:glycosyltransferase involved in cell wall biosynthesis